MATRLAVLLLVALVEGCGGSTSAGGGGGNGGAGGVCMPGHQVACACVDGSTSAQVCNTSGTAFEACQCGFGLGGAGGTAFGGAGGSGGSGGFGAGGSGGTGGTGGGGDPTCAVVPNCVTPPDPQSGAPPGSAASPTVLAVRKVFLGDTDRNDQPSQTAWKTFGFNLDGIVSAKTGTNHCKPMQGANPANVKTDGNGGIDNSFGSNLLPLVLSLSADASYSTNDAIARGEWSLLLSIDHLDANPSQSAVDGFVVTGTRRGVLPAWDGSDFWTAYTSTATPLSPGYVSGGVWVGRATSTFEVGLIASTFMLPLRIDRAIFAGHLTGSGPSAAIADGTIAGVMDTEALIAAFKQVAGAFDTSLCDGSTFDSIAQQIRAANDIMSDGSNGDPSVTCNAISIGLGFTAQAASLGGSAVQPVVPNPCN